jgi:hypothetical protein
MKLGKGGAFISVIAIAFFATAPANANSLVATSPISGATISSVPSSVTVTAQIALLPDGNEVTVTDPKGHRVDDGTITIDAMSASVGLSPLVDTGIYKVSYTLLADGEDPLVGNFTFNFSSSSVIAPAPTTKASPTATAHSASSSWGTNVFVIAMLVLAFFILIGLVIYARKLFINR